MLWIWEGRRQSDFIFPHRAFPLIHIVLCVPRHWIPRHTIHLVKLPRGSVTYPMLTRQTLGLNLISPNWVPGNSAHTNLSNYQHEISRWALSLLSTKRARENVIKNRMRHTVELLHNQAIIMEERILKRELEDIWTNDNDLWRQTARVQ